MASTFAFSTGGPRSVYIAVDSDAADTDFYISHADLALAGNVPVQLRRALARYAGSLATQVGQGRFRLEALTDVFDTTGNATLGTLTQFGLLDNAGNAIGFHKAAGTALNNLAFRLTLVHSTIR